MNAHILVVEDDHDARNTLAYLLKYTGYQVTQAADGETAIDLLEKAVFDVVLSDIVLGEVSGMEVLQAARKQPYVPEVILLTGHASLDTAILAVRQEAYDYLLKPCMDDDLLSCVEAAVQRHLAERQVRDATHKLITALSVQAASESRAKEEPQPQPMSAAQQQRGVYPMHIGNLSIGNSRYKVFFKGTPLQITLIEYDLLHYLAETPGQPRAYGDIVRHTHKIDCNDAEARTLLSPHLRNLRKKFDPTYLVTIRGTGYMLTNPEE